MPRATHKVMKKIAERAIADQKSKPKTLAPKKQVTVTESAPIANIKVGGKVIGQMKSVTIPTATRILSRPTNGAPTGTARNMGLNPRTKTKLKAIKKVR